LDSGAKAIGNPIAARKTAEGYRFPIGEPPTPWYLIRVVRQAESLETAMKIPPAIEFVWVKCSQCNESYQMPIRDYYMELEEKAQAHPSPLPIAYPLRCAKCGQDGVRKAFQCDQCGVVFFANSVPHDFEDRCPKCRHSTTETRRKARLSGSTGL
jgi:phage FluMu protein Com